MQMKIRRRRRSSGFFASFGKRILQITIAAVIILGVFATAFYFWIWPFIQRLIDGDGGEINGLIALLDEMNHPVNITTLAPNRFVGNTAPQQEVDLRTSAIKTMMGYCLSTSTQVDNGAGFDVFNNGIPARFDQEKFRTDLNFEAFNLTSGEVGAVLNIALNDFFPNIDHLLIQESGVNFRFVEMHLSGGDNGLFNLRMVLQLVEGKNMTAMAISAFLPRLTYVVVETEMLMNNGNLNVQNTKVGVNNFSAPALNEFLNITLTMFGEHPPTGVNHTTHTNNLANQLLKDSLEWFEETFDANITIVAGATPQFRFAPNL